jgi:GH24 family phage-related lysozyme (muramidase)
MTQQFDEGVREILLGLVSLGATAFEADYIFKHLNKRPESPKEKIEALEILQRKASSQEEWMDIESVKDYIQKHKIQKPEILFPKTSKKPYGWDDEPVRDTSSKEDILKQAAKYITPFEIYGNDITTPENSKFVEPYQDDKKYWTIGIGTLIGKGTPRDRDHFIQERRRQGKPAKISHKEAIEMFEAGLNSKYNLLERVFKDQWDTFSDEMKVVLIDIAYRGDLISRQTGKIFKFVGHIKNKDFQKAAKEYLNHEEYKKRLREGNNDSVVRRMNSNYNIMKKEK